MNAHAERGDFVAAVQVLANAVADGVRATPEQFLHGGDVVADQRGFVARARRSGTGVDPGNVGLHADRTTPRTSRS